MKHLDDPLYRRILSDPTTLDAELRAHLGSDCAECTSYLEGLAMADPLDGRVDFALLGIAGGGLVEPARPRELAGILARIPSKQVARPPRLLWLGSLAAGILAVILGVRTYLGPVGEANRYRGEKGAAPLTVAASVTRVGPSGALSPAQAGGAFQASDALSVRVDLSRSGSVSLVRSGTVQGGSSEVLLLNEPVSQGQHELVHDGAPVGVSMEGLAGKQQLSILASDHPLTGAEALKAAQGEEVQGVTVSHFDFTAVPRLP